MVPAYFITIGVLSVIRHALQLLFFDSSTNFDEERVIDFAHYVLAPMFVMLFIALVNAPQR